MPKRWEARAGVGAALLVVVVPVATLTIGALGFRVARGALWGLFGSEMLLGAFALLLILLPRRAWNFGRRTSDVLHGLTSPEVTVLMNTKDASTGIICAFQLTVMNHANVPIRVYVQELEVTIREGNLRPVSPMPRISFLVPASRGTYLLRSSTVVVPRDSLLLNAEVDLNVLYGPASGRFEVQWRHLQLISFVPDPSLGSSGVTASDREPDIHTLIRPVDLATLVATTPLT